jgi:hypothetical protein
LGGNQFGVGFLADIVLVDRLGQGFIGPEPLEGLDLRPPGSPHQALGALRPPEKASHGAVRAVSCRQ